MDYKIEQMKQIEDGFRRSSGLLDRRYYKIFYSPLVRAEILLLGLQPKGRPQDFSPDGVRDYKRGTAAAASAGFHENGENDLLDCDWPFAKGIRKLINTGLYNSFSEFRANTAACNMSFVRRNKFVAREFAADSRASAAGLEKILEVVAPTAILTTFDFDRNAIPGAKSVAVSLRETEPSVGHIILQSGSAKFGTRTIPIFGVAHPSQFSWIYLHNRVGARIRAALDAA